MAMGDEQIRSGVGLLGGYICKYRSRVVDSERLSSTEYSSSRTSTLPIPIRKREMTAYVWPDTPINQLAGGLL